VVECAIKKSSSFESVFISKINKDSKMVIISQILNLKCGFKIIQLMLSNFSETNNSIIMSVITSFIEVFGLTNDEINQFYQKHKHLIINKQNNLKNEQTLCFTDKIKRIDNNVLIYSMPDKLSNQIPQYLTTTLGNTNYSYMQYQQGNFLYQNNCNNSMLYNAFNNCNHIYMNNYNNNFQYYPIQVQNDKQIQPNNTKSKET
jgi:hypothetical protein